ncbi:hypothetical protein F2P81_019479 [Scophthalmus maximus]|uniref:Uncharacterized protein n=1 Tax=Scophthalmus maximus TaxID=52904 RepID=A0A6A4SCS6_SCOMX|nr:hypothetical protein F2P81_019479 [Scophthalmus maximus]
MTSLFSSRDVQVKNMEQTVRHAERHLGEICFLLGSYTRKTAKLRDKADLLVARLLDFSGTEGPELQVGLRNLAEDLAMVQDYRQAQVERLDTRVVAPLKAYGDIVKNKRKFSADMNRELKELQKLEKLRLKSPADRQSITIFSDFITVEMLFHAKALEVYTHSHHNLEAMNIQKDLELFSGRLQMSDSLTGHLDTGVSSRSSPLMGRYPSPSAASPKGQSLRATLAATIGHNTRQQHDQLAEKARRSRSTLHRQRGMEEEEELEDEEEDDDEEEEEEEEEEVSEAEEAQHVSRQSYAVQYARMRRWQK